MGNKSYKFKILSIDKKKGKIKFKIEKWTGGDIDRRVLIKGASDWVEDLGKVFKDSDSEVKFLGADTEFRIKVDSDSLAKV